MDPDNDLSSDVSMDGSSSSLLSSYDSSYDISGDGDDNPSDSESANEEEDDSTCQSHSHDVPPVIHDSLLELEYLQDLHFLQQSTFWLKNENWRHKQLNWNDHVEQLL
jgi:hypothetical protein